MKFIIIGENCLTNLSTFDTSIFSTFQLITSIYARQLAAVTPSHNTIIVKEHLKDICYTESCDAVLIHFKTATANNAYTIADNYRKNHKTVILSGTHTSALPSEAQQHSDSIIIGNAEQLWPQITRDLEHNTLKPKYKQTQINNTVPKESSRIIFPPGIKIFGIIEATRGCPYKCDFCQDSHVCNGSTFRVQPIETVIAELEMLPQKMIFFCDVSMTIDPRYTKQLFTAMKPLNKKFVCEGNADVLAIDEELLHLAHEAGCIEWTIGFETITQEILNSLHKKTNCIKEFNQVVTNIHKHDMAVLGNFMFGFDQDTNKVFSSTIEKINELNLDSARFAILTPYPGTPLYHKLELENRILTYDWSLYNRKNVVFEPKNITREDLFQGFTDISRQFNSIPNMLRRDLQSLTHGIYPSIITIGRNIENYINRPTTKTR
jgi:radical SAM superfamily enzyme YgiQ (UPF0313 family)